MRNKVLSMYSMKFLLAHTATNPLKVAVQGKIDPIEVWFELGLKLGITNHEPVAQVYRVFHGDEVIGNIDEDGNGKWWAIDGEGEHGPYEEDVFAIEELVKNYVRLRIDKSFNQ